MNHAGQSGTKGSIVVAGDICLDVIGIPVPPPPPSETQADNWKQSGETRTHYLLGGALLLERWVKAAAPDWSVHGIVPCRPAALSSRESRQQPLTAPEFLEIAERLKRDEVVHSLLGVDTFPESSGVTNRHRRRIRTTHGFSGPMQGDPTLPVLPPAAVANAHIYVLDDTGNRFRRSRDHWPVNWSQAPHDPQAVVVYKLHRPLPGPDESGNLATDENAPDLWRAVEQRFGSNRVIIVTIDDLRSLDAPISQGLSWERTSLDIVWQLLNVDAFTELRDCPHLIIRLGLDGAVYWRRTAGTPPKYHAWLVYDPHGIEGTGASQCEGGMVGYGSAFTSGVVGRLASAGCDSQQTAPAEALLTESDDIPVAIRDGIIAGLRASRRLLALGYGDNAQPAPDYPDAELFAPASPKDAFFGCEPIPIIPGATVPDRAFWRLLDTIFLNKTGLLHKAVELSATGARPRSPEDEEAARLLKRVPMAVFAKALRTCDRREIENYRALYTLMLDYINKPNPPRPLSVAVFGPPGAGKSFGVKMVAKALGQLGGPRPIETLTFNLSQYQDPDDLADAFHLIRDLVLRGKIPLVFFDEFDTTLGQTKLGWLRYFLAPMQDSEFLDDGTPHPIGQAIFVFAGGTCSTYGDFARPFLVPESDTVRDDFKAAKGPDFLSRLRGTLDIPGLDLNVEFDAYGPVDAFPCEAAILLRRAGILSHQLRDKAPRLVDSTGALQVSPVVLRALLHTPEFLHGNRSFEALLDMSRLSGADKLSPSLLPSASHIELHANSSYLAQLIATHYPYPPRERELIASSIHATYVERKAGGKKSGKSQLDNALQNWEDLPEGYKESNREQADHIAVKLRVAGLWFRKRIPGYSSDSLAGRRLDELLEALAQSEHDRWVAEKRRTGWAPAAGIDRKYRNDQLLLHNCLFPWSDLTEDLRNLDRDTVQKIPDHLAAADYEIIQM